MFTVRPYPSNPSIRIHFDGTSMRDGRPAALEIAEGMVLFDKQPFPDSQNQMVTLNPAEAGALACASVGMDGPEICERLDLWFDADVRVLRSAFNKLSGQNDLHYRVPFVVGAFDKGVYVPHIPPRLTPIRYSLRQRFFDVTAKRAENMSIEEIATALGIEIPFVYGFERSMASDLGFGKLKKNSLALVTLAGAAEALPSQRNGERFVVEASLLTADPLTRPPREGLFRPLPDHKTQKIMHNPTEDFFNVLRFAGQPLELGTPDMHTGYVDEIRLCGAAIAVNDVIFQNHEGIDSWLTPIEMAALLLKTMLKTKVVEKLTGSNGGRSPTRCGQGPLLRAYNKLLPPSKGPRRYRSIEPAIRSAFEKRLLVPLRRPDTTNLDGDLKEKLPRIGNSLAEGKGLGDAATELGWSLRRINQSIHTIRQALNVTTAGLVLITEAERWLDKDAASLTTKTIPERAA